MSDSVSPTPPKPPVANGDAKAPPKVEATGSTLSSQSEKGGLFSTLRKNLCRMLACQEVRLEVSTKVKVSEITIVDAYKILTDYDLHYSTVRTSVVTFLISFSFGLAAFLLKDSHGDLAMQLGTIIPAAFLFIAGFMCSHFQRLTAACQMIQKDLEEPGKMTGEDHPFAFRALLDKKYNKTRVWKFWDPGNFAYMLTVLLFMASLGAFWNARKNVPEYMCIIPDGKTESVCGKPVPLK